MATFKPVGSDIARSGFFGFFIRNGLIIPARLQSSTGIASRENGSPSADTRRAPHPQRNVDVQAAGAGSAAMHAIDLDGRADERDVIERIQHQADVRRRQRARWHRVHVDVDAQLRIEMLGGDAHGNTPCCFTRRGTTRAGTPLLRHGTRR
ncbi:hypothetical protein G6F35_011567 [Rhizopus arrhizus]|nr:hypothetical protein G6F35_011567 [Rhizopus arrhizus]